MSKLSKNAKILITGSHFTPAEAVTTQLQDQGYQQIVYVGRKTTMEGDKTPSAESQILPKMGVKYRTITTGRVQRSLTWYTIPSLLKIPWGLLHAGWILFQEKPQIIVSFGGFVAVPIVVMGWLMRIPIIIHEQTLVTGLANSVSALFATKIAVTFDANYDFPKSKVVVTGNPMRESIIKATSMPVDKQLARLVRLAKKANKPLIMITGGNQGSHAINLAIEQALPQLAKDYFIVHQSGDSKYHDAERLEKLALKLKINHKYLVRKWINGADMASLLKAATIVVSRAGINTLYELAYLKVPSLLIPVPYLHKNEQTVNARYFEKLGVAQVLLQQNLTAESLIYSIKKLIVSLDDRQAALKQTQKIVKLTASQDIVELIIKS